MGERKGLVMVFIACVLFSIGGLCVKMIPWQGMSINGFRSILSVGILLLFAKITHHRMRLTKGVLIGALAVCSSTICYALATKLTTAANAILLQFTAPAFVILSLWLFFRERPKKLDLLACCFVFGGIACFFLDSLGTGKLLGDAIAVLAGVGYAWVFMMNKLPGGDPLFATILGQSMGAVIGLPFLVQETEFGSQALFYATLLGVFQLGLAYVFLTTGIRYAPPVSAALVSGIEPILNPILVAVVMGETIRGLSLVGGGIVFVSVMGYNLLAARQTRAAAQELADGACDRDQENKVE